MSRAAASLLLAAALLAPQTGYSGAYVSATESEPNIRTHPRNFDGTGGELDPIRVCLDIQTNAALAVQAEPALLKAIATMNRFRSLGQHTFALGSENDVPSGQFDFESVLLHELLHATGLDHPNHADESGLPSGPDNGTKSADGADDVFNQGAGADGIHGSSDDVRGDDINLHWYQKGVNHPGLLPSLVDETTHARALDFLPGGHLFAANADRSVLAALGLVNAEAAAQQGIIADEAQRHLQHDDVASILLARAGLNGIAGDADDYRTTLTYRGRFSADTTENCQINVRFDESTGFASTSLGNYRITPNHWGTFFARIRFNPNVNWYLSPGPNTATTIVSDLPDSSALATPFVVQVSVTKTGGNPITALPQGRVEVRDGPRYAATTASCSIDLLGTPGEIGACTLTPLSSGNKTLVAEYLGHGGFDASSDTEAHLVTGSVAFSATSATPNPVAVGVPAAFQWTLAAPAGQPTATPTGTVTLKDAPDCASAPVDAAHQCTRNLSGAVGAQTQSCSITFNSAAARNLQLCYSGDTAYPATSATLAHTTVNGRATTTTLTSLSPSPSSPFQPLVAQFTVRENPDLGGFPSGVVEVSDGPASDPMTARCRFTLLGVANEVGSCTLVPLRARPVNLTASFFASNIWAASSATRAQSIRRFAIVSNSPSTSRVGQGVFVRVNVDVERYLQTPSPTGTVTISDGVDQCQFALALGNGCFWTGRTVGTRTLTASWPGDSNHAPASSTVSQTVLPAGFPQLVSNSVIGYEDGNGSATLGSRNVNHDGRWVVFSSDASNLVAGDTNSVGDIFLRDVRSGEVRRISVDANGAQANGLSDEPSISANGRFVAFTSLASNLVPGDTNNVRDVFVKDLSDGSIVRANLTESGQQDTTNSSFNMEPALSADGRFVAFMTFGRLVAADNESHTDIYVRDLQAGTLDLVSTTSSEQLGDWRSYSPAISADGRYVAFMSQAFNFDPNDFNGTGDVFVKDRLTRTLKTVSASASGVVGLHPTMPATSLAPSISANGRFVAFHSIAPNLVPGDTGNNWDVFVKDTETGAIEIVSITAGGVQGGSNQRASISADGRYVAFVSDSINLVPLDTNNTEDILLKDRSTGQLTRISEPTPTTQFTQASLNPSISGDGRMVAFTTTAPAAPGDSNNLADVYLRGTPVATLVRVSSVSFGARGDAASDQASISRDGRYAVFTSAASTLIASDSNGQPDVFLQDRNNGLITRVSSVATGNGNSNGASEAVAISADNQWLAFLSSGSNLVSGDTNALNDVFVAPLGSTAHLRVSTASGGAQRSSGAISGPLSISGNGNWVSFSSGDSNLVPADNNGFSDIFVKNRATDTTLLLSSSATGVPGNGHSLQAQLSDDGSVAVFASDASNLVSDDSNGVRDIFVKTIGTGAIARISSTGSGAQANGASSNPAISSDGRFVAFASAASNLVAGDSNGLTDIFVKDLTSGSVIRVSVDAAGTQGVGGDCSSPSISSNGRYIGFICAMSNLVPGDSNAQADLFVKDQVTGAITRGSITDTSIQANAASTATARAISDDGFMLFSSAADNLLDANTDAVSDVFLNRFSVATSLESSVTITAHTPEPSPRDSAYLVSVSVNRGAAVLILSGSVLVSEGANSCVAALTPDATGASGSCTLISNVVGVRTLTAVYSGDLNYAAATAPVVNHSVSPIRPGAPIIGLAVAGNGEVRVQFNAPLDNGGASINGYTATCGSRSAFASAAPITVTGLPNGTPVSCSVTAQNAAGTGPASTPSNTVTPNGAQSLVGPLAYVPTQNTGRLAVIDLGSQTVIDQIAVGAASLGIAVSPDGTRAYVVDQAGGNVRVINTATRGVIATLTTGAGAWSAAVSPDGSRVLVSNNTANTVSVINTSTNTVIGTVNSVSRPTSLVVAPDGSKVYVGNNGGGNLVVIALPSLAVSQINVGTVPYGLALSPDGSRLYMVNSQPGTFGRALAMDTASNTIVGSVQVGDQPLAIAVSPDGTRAYASNNRGNTLAVINTATWTVLATVPTGPRPLGVDVHPNGSRVYVGNNDGSMSVIDTATQTPIGTITVDSGAVSAIGNFIARNSVPPANRSFAVGSITLPATGPGANAKTRVFFPQPFSATPIVIVQGDNADSDPKALRLSNITGSSFDVLQVEPQGCAGCTGAGGATTVHWLAALPGSYRLPNEVPLLRNLNAPNIPGPGVLVQVGSVLTMASQRASGHGGFAGFAPRAWESVSFAQTPDLSFSAPPVVLTSLQSWGRANEGDNLSVPAPPARPSLSGVSRLWLTTAVRNVSATGFETALESSSSDDSGAATPGLKNPESIGYVAIESAVSTQLTVLGGNTVALATGTGTATGACSDTSLSFPSGSSIIAANLRGFGGMQSRNEDDGGWLRRCSLANPGGATVNIGTRVDEDADLKTDRSHPSTETIGAAIFGGDFVTTPVSLAFLQAHRSGERLEVRFGSATEAGHLGYRLWGRADADQAWRALHEDLIIDTGSDAGGDSMRPRSYQRLVDAAGVSEIRVEDIDILGQSRFHPAVRLDANGHASVGTPAIKQNLDWTAIRAANVLSQRRNTPATQTGSVLASVRKSGIQRASFEDLVAAGFAGNALAADLAILENGQPVPRFVDCASSQFGPGCAIEWIGTPRNSLYGRERIYEIRIDRVQARPVGSGALVDGPGVPRSFTTELELSPNRGYSFSAPGDDPWFDARLSATTSPVETTRSFTLPHRVPGSGASLTVKLWGGLDYTGAQNTAPDHSVELLLNGNRMARRRFDGLVEEIISLELSDAQLQANNVLTIRVLGDTGYPADVVLLDGFKVRYSSSSNLRDGALSIGDFNAASASGEVLFQDGMEPRSGFAVAGIHQASTIWSQSHGVIKRDRASTNVYVDQRVNALWVANDAQVQRPTLSAGVATEGNFGPADYLIVTHPLFTAELQPLIALQQSRGYSVRVLRTDAIYAAKSAHQRSPQAIREAIHAVNPRFVLLVGGDSYDYDDNLGVGSQSFLPTFYRVANPIVRFAASDADYADSNGDGAPERAIGRLPARTVEELQRVIQATLTRGNQPVGSYFAAAGQSASHEHFGVHSRAMLSYLRQGQRVDFGLSDEIGPLDARSQATAALAGGNDWISYLGHSSPNRWAFQNLLDTTQLAGIQRSATPAIVSQWGCWNSYFVMPNQDTMSHALMLRSNTLAAAVIGSSSLAEDASHLALGTRFFDLLEDGRIDNQAGAPINTLGEALQRAKLDLARSAPEHLESNYSITLFGDPAMRIR
ncbi:MAG: C25 family cysteine peptidase [Xanthomonadales bacterium]|jgi:YVTN family beta-propeller protein|nr:C25 family cysteine peptidase [Xanthomonadales bacterium]